VREICKRYKSLGQFNLENIPQASKRRASNWIAFDIDANGILTVSATDKATGKAQEIKISGSSGLDESEIEKMVKDAGLHKEEDKKRKEGSRGLEIKLTH